MKEVRLVVIFSWNAKGEMGKRRWGHKGKLGYLLA